MLSKKVPPPLLAPTSLYTVLFSKLQSRFNAGDFTTNYLPETYPDGFKPFGGKLSSTEINHLAGIAAVLYCKDQQRSREILNDQMIKNQRTMITSMNLTVNIAGERIRVSSRNIYITT